MPRRRSDIENERLPPDLIDAESEEGKAIFAGSTSGPSTPALEGGAPEGAVPSPGTLSEHLTQLESVTPDSISPASPGSPITPMSPVMPGAFRMGHRRQASLGTTKTSPSTRRRSIEGTMALIKEVVDGGDPADGEWAKLADDLVGKPNGAETPTAKS
jgi:serine/threonine-protein phosphatase 2B catalytic subunit